MVDAEVVRRRLREIDRRLGWLRSIHEAGRTPFLGDPGVQAQAERHLQLAIQSCIDIALHAVSESTAETPEDYGSAFVILSRAGMLDAALADRLRLATGLRNVLVHGYLDVDPERVWDQLGRLDDLEAFALAALALVER